MDLLFKRLKRHIQHEPNRYLQKGYGFLSIFQVLFFFMIIPKILFYIWPKLLNFSRPQNLYLVGTLSINLIIHNIGIVFYYFVYTKKINLEKYRISPNKSWPWEQNKDQWKKLLIKTIKYIGFNNYIFLPIVTFVDSWSFNYRYTLQTWPTLQQILYQFCIFQIFQNVANYVFHALFHHPKLYYFHKLHHEYTTSITLTSLYFHPVQFVFTTILTGGSGSMYLKPNVHLCTIFMWIAYKSISNVDSHCGYQLPWSPLRLLPYSISSQYHFFHHSHNVGTYDAGICLLDTVFGDNQQYFNYIDAKKKLSNSKIN